MNEKIDMSLIESPEKKHLLELEKSGQWVFHGSADKLQELEPQQAYTYPKNSKEGRVADGNPAVFASPFADIAIFMALINRQNAPKGLRSGFGSSRDGGLEFRVTQETIDQMHNVKGYVYVFDKDKFTPRSQTEVLTHNKVSPDEIVEVSERDLPHNILIEDF